MARWAEFCRRMGGLWRRRQMARDLEEEIAFHVRAREESLRADGVPDAQAAWEARHCFGNRLRAHERSMEPWGWRWLESAMQDVRFAGRMLVRRPLFSLVVIAVLALGIGLNAAMFFVVDAVRSNWTSYGRALRRIARRGNGSITIAISRHGSGMRAASTGWLHSPGQRAGRRRSGRASGGACLRSR